VSASTKLVEDFLSHLRSKGRKRKTIDFYRKDLMQFFEFLRVRPDLCGVADRKVQLRLVRPGTISKFLHLLRNEGHNARAHHIHTCLRRFFGFLESHKGWLSNPAKSVYFPYVQRHNARGLTVEQIEELLSLPRVLNNEKGLRDTAMLELFYATGMKTGELVRLEAKDISFARDWVKIRGEDRKDRIVPIVEAASDALRAYLDYLTEIGSYSGPRVFQNLRGSSNGITDRSADRIVKDYGKELGLDVTPSIIRNTMGTHLRDRGATEEYVQAILGVTDPAVKVYNRPISVQDSVSIYREVHPRVKWHLPSKDKPI